MMLFTILQYGKKITLLNWNWKNFVFPRANKLQIVASRFHSKTVSLVPSRITVRWMYHVSIEIEGLLRRGVNAGRIKVKNRAHTMPHFYVTFS